MTVREKKSKLKCRTEERARGEVSGGFSDGDCFFLAERRKMMIERMMATSNMGPRTSETAIVACGPATQEKIATRAPLRKIIAMSPNKKSEGTASAKSGLFLSSVPKRAEVAALLTRPPRIALYLIPLMPSWRNRT